MNRYVFDSFAWLAYAENEPGSATVSAILKEALDIKSEIFLSVVNWGEMYCIAYREGGQDIFETYPLNVDKFPIQVVSPDQEMTMLAAIIKATNKVSNADTFAAALANLKNASLVTGNPEFKRLEKDINILWIK